MSATSRVVVVGSVNIDMMLRCPHLPGAGETVMGSDFAAVPGGKGANQAVAAARLGAPVTFVGALGTDDTGAAAIQALQREGIDLQQLHRFPDESTGVAVVLTDEHGENCIALSPGANARLSLEHIDAAASSIRGASMLLCQLESPIATVQRAIEIAAHSGVPVLLNPAPASPIPRTWFPQIDMLVPNVVEAAALCGRDPIKTIDEAFDAATQLRAMGAKRVIVTLGAQGAVVADGDQPVHCPAPAVEVVDTTGAGDTFVGALAAGLVQGLPLHEAVTLAQQAAGYSVTRRGAQAGMPTLADLKRAPLRTTLPDLSIASDARRPSLERSDVPEDAGITGSTTR